MQEGLSLDQAPPFSAPLRFFLTAPLFGILAGLGLFLHPEILSSRWHGESIGTIHLITLGFIAMTIAGAMMQMLPVLAGKTVKRPLLFAWVIHILLAAGALLFAFSFYFRNFYTLLSALICIFIALAYFFTYTSSLIFRTKNMNDTIRAMSLSLFALFLVIASGFVLGLLRSGVPIPVKLLHFPDMHLVWALMGWAGILIAGVSYQVFPMFYITTPLHPLFRKYFAPSVIFLLIVWSGFTAAGGSEIVRDTLSYLLGILMLVYALLTLNIFKRRKRKNKDASLYFFYTGYISLALSVGIFHFYSGMTATVIYLYGFIVSVIYGMMFRIIPFLTFFHLSSLDPLKAPTMKKILPEKFAKAQFWIHLSALSVLSVSVILYGEDLPGASASGKLSGTLISVSSAFLFYNLFKASFQYFKLRSGMAKDDASVFN